MTASPMFLGIEIGGTKLQLGVGAGDGSELAGMERRDVDPERGAAGILEQIQEAGRPLIEGHDVERIGFGFGGPVDAAAGRVITSHQIAGWDDVPLVDWCRQTFGLPAVLGNDCNAASLAEARFGAGRGRRVVFFVTVGTGIGGGLVIDGILQGADRPAVAEIGHMRSGLYADRPHQTVESVASGWGIAAGARKRMKRRKNSRFRQQDISDLLERSGSNLDQLTTQMIARAASDGNELAFEVLYEACLTLGWAVAQVVTLLAPEVIVIGGGVSLIGEELFFHPLREAVRRYVFPPLEDSYEILPAELGELVVVHGALALAADTRNKAKVKRQK